MNIPKELRYSKDHEWASVSGDTATAGITQFAVEQLGDITLVELPEVGKTVKAGDVIGVIESVKAVSDLYSPLSGKIREINQELEDAPEKVNEDPYGQGWMFKLDVQDKGEIEALFDAADYETHLNSLED